MSNGRYKTAAAENENSLYIGNYLNNQMKTVRVHQGVIKEYLIDKKNYIFTLTECKTKIFCLGILSITCN